MDWRAPIHMHSGVRDKVPGCTVQLAMGSSYYDGDIGPLDHVSTLADDLRQNEVG